MSGEVFGERTLQFGDVGDDITELQIRIAGFKNSGIIDGEFGTRTKISLMAFQRDFMKIPKPSGICDLKTFDATDTFASQFPIFTLFNANLKCPCGDFLCQDPPPIGSNGYGHDDFDGVYRAGKAQIEAYHQKEYLGIHRVLLWSVRAVFFYLPQYTFTVNSGYRCRVDNVDKGRQSTNHHGKAIDIDPGNQANCDAGRRQIVNVMDAQIGWGSTNKKALEPSRIAPNWIHMDVRTYDQQFLLPQFFATNETELNNQSTHTITDDVTEEAEEPLLDAQEEVVKEQENRQYNTGDPSCTPGEDGNTGNENVAIENKDFGWIDVANGIFNYITDSNNYELNAITAGSIVTPAAVVIPVPADPLDINIYFNEQDTLLSFIQNVTDIGLPDGGIQNFFIGLNTWLNTPPFTLGLTAGVNATVLTSNGITLTPPDVGAPGLNGLVFFPTVVQQGVACDNEMKNTEFEGDTKQQRRKAWEIMNKYIKLALNQNVIPPIPTVGVGTGAYTGITTVTYVYK